MSQRIPRAEYGQLTLKELEGVSYWQYVPRARAARVLVLAHGSTSDPERDMVQACKNYASKWLAFAKSQKLIVIAPVFDVDHFASSQSGKYGSGGYRGLVGRYIDADELVIKLATKYSAHTTSTDTRILLTGHSAGGQFTCRFIIRHPDQIASAVIGSAGRFSYPDLSANWPYGAGPTKGTIRWSETETREIDVTPDIETWVEAATLPIFAVVGADDLDPQPKRPAHRGTTRVELAQSWVADMNALAAERGEIGNTRVIVVPGNGHNGAELPQAAQRAFIQSRRHWQRTIK
jgi:pimeloyl-ACP methyl ester carboxylesterase